MCSASTVSFNFPNVPAKALSILSRQRLSLFLNSEQLLPSSVHGIAQDYRGLAEQMGFEWNDIKRFKRSEDPTSKILEVWESRSDATIAELIQFLEKMGRYDVIEDLLDKFENDAKVYLERNQIMKQNLVQAPEVIYCDAEEYPSEDNIEMLTVDDVQTGEVTKYDAYVCYADENISFVYELANYLESPMFGFKLFIRDRDLLLGASETKSNVKLMEERCNRMLIILTPDFLRSSECEFQASFAASLAIEQRRRKLIPIILAECEIPLILKYVSKIDLSKPDVQTWTLQKLVSSICDTKTIFVSSVSGQMLENQSQLLCLKSGSADASTPFLTFPLTVNRTSAVGYDNSMCSSSISSVALSDSTDIKSVQSLTSNQSTPRFKQRLISVSKSLQMGFKRLASRCSRVSSSSKTSSTSCFYIENGDSKSTDVMTDGCSYSTAL